MKRRMSATATDFLHSFSCDVTGQELPQRFNNPFSYRPHALCVLAAGEVRSYIGRSEQLKAEVAEGKMFGVLVVRTPQGRGKCYRWTSTHVIFCYGGCSRDGCLWHSSGGEVKCL